ncbi:MAG TPA: SMP-30/gluconolactonase/LRE family protein, partial [Pyrinomonadaceae bacterium]|nr:SMP-30/gluconolactonase/LRE family protein [Pyrinomonadaceae bacterium]
ASLACGPGTLAQSPQDVRPYLQKARDAYRAKNYPELIESMKQALNLRPNYGRYVYTVAAGYALSGNKEEAFAWLNRLADMGLVYAIDRDDDFKSLKGDERFIAAIQRFENNRKPIGNSVNAFTVNEKGLVPEGIAYDPVEKIFYLGAVYKRKIIRVNSAGEAKDFSSPADNLWSVMGMRVDSKRRVLWVCTASHPQMMNFNEKENGLSGVFKYDLKTGKLVKKYLVPADSKSHWLGDLVLDSRGEVFATDSVTPAIYRLNQEKDSLEVFLKNDAFVNVQGLAFSKDEKQLFMADYLKGVFVIDMKTKMPTLMATSPTITMLGLDGLYFHDWKLIGIQNGVSPNRLVQISMKDTEVTKLEVLEANNTVFDEPTLAVLVGDSLFYIANSQWGAIDEKGRLASVDKLKDPVVLKIKL